eukprot:2886574-Amphidinium_carterae.1
MKRLVSSAHKSPKANRRPTNRLTKILGFSLGCEVWEIEKAFGDDDNSYEMLVHRNAHRSEWDGFNAGSCRSMA